MTAAWRFAQAPVMAGQSQFKLAAETSAVDGRNNRGRAFLNIRHQPIPEEKLTINCSPQMRPCPYAH